jgi:hypothetical protein
MYINANTHTYTHTQGVSQRALQLYSKCYFVVSVTIKFALKSIQTIYGSTLWKMDSLYTFKCKRFCNTCHTVTFGIPLYSSFWNALHYHWKSHWTVTIPHKTWCVCLHYDSSKQCTCPLIHFYKLSKMYSSFWNTPHMYKEFHNFIHDSEWAFMLFLECKTNSEWFLIV